MHGLAELLVDIGAMLAKGKTTAILRDVNNLTTKALEITSPQSGIVAVRRSVLLVTPSDHLLLIAIKYEKLFLAM